MNITEVPQHAGRVALFHHARLRHARRADNGARELYPSSLRTVVAQRPDQLDAAHELVARRYAARGYRISRSTAPDPHNITLLAQEGDQLRGSLTVRPGSAGALLAEGSYAAEIEQLRRDGCRVGELVKLVVEEGADWRAALDALVQSAYVVTRVVHGLTHVVIEVNPRHVSFHRRVFGFVVAGAERFCSRVQAPSVLLLLDLEVFGSKLQLSSSYTTTQKS